MTDFNQFFIFLICSDRKDTDTQVLPVDIRGRRNGALLQHEASQGVVSQYQHNPWLWSVRYGHASREANFHKGRQIFEFSTHHPQLNQICFFILRLFYNVLICILIWEAQVFFLPSRLAHSKNSSPFFHKKVHNSYFSTPNQTPTSDFSSSSFL